MLGWIRYLISMVGSGGVVSLLITAHGWNFNGEAFGHWETYACFVFIMFIAVEAPKDKER